MVGIPIKLLWPDDDERDLGTRRPQISACQNYALVSWWNAGKRLYTHVLTKRAEQEVIIKREAKTKDSSAMCGGG